MTMDSPVRVSLDFPRSGQKLDVFVTIPVKLRSEDAVREGRSHQDASSYSAVYNKTASLEPFATAA
jgi:hypothetical protein